MSAYLVDRHHIAYLAKYAEEKGILPYLEMSVVQLANELEQENIKSIHHRYPDSVNDTGNMPGDTELLEPWTHSELKAYIWLHFKPLQVMKSCHCYAYQACEHEGWEKSRAKKAIEQIESYAVHRLPGVDEMEWGAPKPYSRPRQQAIQHDI